MCGQSPLYVPTTINAQIRNIDAVDVAATSISCTNLTVNGEPVSTTLQNVGSSTPGSTVFTGTLTADNLSTSGTTNTGAIVASSANITGSGLTASTITSTGTISALAVAATGDVSGATLTGTVATATQNNITKIGTQTSLVVSGSTTLASLSASGNITQSAGSTTLKTVTSDTNTISSGNTLAFAGTTAQQKVNLQSGTYGIGVSSNQLNLVTPTTGALVYYGGGTNADGTERFRVNSTGATVAGDLTIGGALTVSGTSGKMWYSLSQVNASSTTTIEVLNIPGDPRIIRIHLYDIKISSSPTFFSGPQLQFGADTTYTGTTYSTWTTGDNGTSDAYHSDGIMLWNTPNGTVWDTAFRIHGVIEISNVGNGYFVVTGSLGRLQSTTTNWYNAQVNGYVGRANNSRFNRLRLYSTGSFSNGTVQVEYVN